MSSSTACIAAFALGCRRRLSAWTRAALIASGIGGTSIPLIVTPSPLAAAEPVWSSQPYKYAVVEQDLTTVLQEFGRNTSQRVEISGEVRGRVRGPWPVLKPGEFLDYLCRSYGLEWYFDGFRLYVTAGKENSSRLISRGAVPLERLRATLGELAIFDERFPLRAVKQSDLVLVSGPPQYVALIERTLAALNSAIKPRREPPSVVTVYRGEQVAVVKVGSMEGGGP